MAILALLLGTQTAPLLPPSDWSRVPSLRWKAMPFYDPTMSAYVRGEVESGRCGAAIKDAGSSTLIVEVALLASADGRIRAVVPRAIHCPTVEQFTAGLIQRVARNRVDTTGQTGDSWYRTTMTYSWNG